MVVMVSFLASNQFVLAMPEGLLPVLVIIAAVIVYVIAKVVANVRKSEQQWQQVVKSKLREWDEEDDWGD